MLNLGFPRDLVMTGAIFGLAAFVWAGWAQEKPPMHWAWRVVLGILSLAGIALAALSIPTAIRSWSTPTVIDPKSAAFVVYIVVFWIEVAACIALAIWATRSGRPDLIAPLILAVVGIHFLPLAAVFGQPIMAVAGVLLTAIAVVAAFVPADHVARSFWCGVFGAPVLLAVGAWCAVAGTQALRSG
ncbi:hypothetical protein [Microbacterium ulmi]|uniref:Uncharacterized protein n=1 Tax=Microbacterium ulmi TaxID=179095 RepID=A0A7Y2M2N0_9MICO|nr:hypothetical protein [Microbacterium ulmi]NII69513.1 hypothetical protein [Microbacterium ulmi]NNH05057.1 hypothetical protein [Microbacterium ulmi]